MALTLSTRDFLYNPTTALKFLVPPLFLIADLRTGRRSNCLRSAQFSCAYDCVIRLDYIDELSRKSAIKRSDSLWGESKSSTSHSVSKYCSAASWVVQQFEMYNVRR